MAGSIAIGGSGRGASTRWTLTLRTSPRETPMAGRASPSAVRDDELLITRTFDAPVALVWRLWEERDHMIRWWGPEGFTCTSVDLDFRPGGRWRISMVSDAYGESW